MKHPPFNTGRVKIGLFYQRPIHHEMSQDAERLQTALLNGKEDGKDIALAIVIGVALAALLVAWWSS